MTKKSEVIKKLRAGEIGVLSTDTVFGLVGRAADRSAVQKIFQLKHRTPTKPLIILLSRLEDLKLFNINLTSQLKRQLSAFWKKSRPVSIILPCPDAKFSYLSRGTKTLAFRLPRSRALRRLISQTGPLVAPSANPEGFPPAESLAAARNYFGAGAHFYYGRARSRSKPSKIIRLNSRGSIDIIRP